MVPGVPGSGGLPAVGRGLCPPELCPRQIKKYEKLDSEEERAVRSRHIFDHYIMKELLACSHVSALPCQGGVPRASGRDVPSVPRGPGAQCLRRELQNHH